MLALAIRLAVGLVSLITIASAVAATHVDLVIDEGRANRTVPWPVTTGIPFPKGGLTDANQCRLIDDRGEEQPLQAKVAATWDATRTSIRWLTIDFVAQPGRKYALEFGPDVVRKPFRTAIDIADANGDVVISTGALQVEFARQGPAALKTVRADLNADGKVTPDELVAAGPKDGDHQFTDERNVSSTGARDGADRTVVVESTGPVRVCVRVDGWYTGPNGERIVRYRTRYHLFAGLPILKVIDEFRVVGSTRDVKFRDVALPLDVQLEDSSRQVTVPFSPSAGGWATQTLDKANESVSTVQETYRHYGNPDCRALLIEHPKGNAQHRQSFERIGPWMQVRDERVAVTGSLRWLWQQFPKEWSGGDGRLTMHLWSPHVDPLDFGESGLRDFFGPAGMKYLLQWKAGGSSTPISDFFYYAGRHGLERDGADGLGISKHHELWYHFGPAGKAKEGQEYGELADAQPLCLATGAWNVGTGVFGPLASRPNDSPGEAIVDRIFDLERYAQDTFGDYGWYLFGAGPHYSYQWDPETRRHYADPRRFEYHTYQRETQLWWCYLRSGERKFYDWAIPSENHWVDIAVSHSSTKFSTEWRGGAKGEAKLHFRPGDWSIDSPLHYVRHHDTGEAWLRSAPQFWATYHRTLETTTLAYYLTGDERYNDVVDFWRDYWGVLAGVRSDSTGVPEWHREQLWWRPVKAGEPVKTWAEMLRDYAPFQSGSRHQQTLLFNLSTLYEHTWDPTIAKALREYADAFLDPASPNGVWQCQDHRLPANANSPMLAHYWSSALWKYARATSDPRMPEVLKKYFTACLEADPYGEDVGIYSNNQIAWAWHFTKDPRHLIAARHELDQLAPNADPLARPEDLGQRIYNPYAPIKALAAVPRLIGALQEARNAGIATPAAPPLNPQRTLIALHRTTNIAMRSILWGWDPHPRWFRADGSTLDEQTQPVAHRSDRQPFDRVLPGYQVFRRETRTIDPASSAWVYLSPRVETGLLELDGADDVWCWAGEPISIEPRQVWKWPRPDTLKELVLESAVARQFIVKAGGRKLEEKLVKNTLVVPLTDVPASAIITIESTGTQPAWFRLNVPDNTSRWVTTSAQPGNVPPLPTAELLATRHREPVDPQQTFIPGRFGQALLLVPGRELHFPNEYANANGTTHQLSDPHQGTLECWMRRFWDDRLTPIARPPLVQAGPVSITPLKEMPLDEWVHVAIVWRPLPNDEKRCLIHVYVDGRDYAFYRSLYWEGYGAKPRTFDVAAQWLKEFVEKAPPGMMFAIDDLRISNRPRYVDLTLDFGREQTFNPNEFAPPSQPLPFDDLTTLLLPLDGNLRGTTRHDQPIEATLIREKPAR